MRCHVATGAISSDNFFYDHFMIILCFGMFLVYVFFYDYFMVLAGDHSKGKRGPDSWLP